MFYIILALICFIFAYCLFIDNKHKIDISYTEESIYNDESFHNCPEITFKADKKKYHFKSAFIGIFVENNSNETISITRDYEIEIKKDDKWFKLDVDNTENITKEILIKPKDSFYQNIFIDKYKDLSDCELRIIKKIKSSEEKIYKTEVKIHCSKAIKEKNNQK